jgi:hypothetical protein
VTGARARPTEPIRLWDTTVMPVRRAPGERTWEQLLTAGHRRPRRPQHARDAAPAGLVAYLVLLAALSAAAALITVTLGGAL